MNYYTARARALQEIGEKLEKGTSRKKIYYFIGIRYGFSPDTVDQMCEIIQGAK